MASNRWREIEWLFHEALARPTAERAAFLAEACGADEEMRREVESLLAQEVKSFMEKPALEVASEGANQKLPPTSEAMKGLTVAHYRVLERLGAGGMGEVYRAEDTRLKRQVALKFLTLSSSSSRPSAGAAALPDATAVARFEREARLASGLNHPNICAIYDVGEYEGSPFIAMELVEGQTLAERIGAARSASGTRSGSAGAIHELPLREGLAIARQVAEALEYAHERGIVHRDLKPANIKIAPEGTVKVLDFGLAKVLTPKSKSEALDPNNSPTVSLSATEVGTILGTAAYMSPEQAKAKPVDRRADIWAFGCVLYEMLSGKKAFEGETVSDVLVAVLSHNPDWSVLPTTTPLSIQKLIRLCLNKDPKQRLRDIGDARIAIEETLSGAGAGLEARPYEETSAARRAPHPILPWALAVILICVAGIAGWRYGSRNAAPSTSRSVVRFSISAPPEGVFHPLGGFLRVSPDGRMLAFVSSGKDRKSMLWIRPLNDLKARPIAGTEGAEWPFWSPDNLNLGFDADGKLKKVAISGGPVQTLADASAGGGTWNRDGVIVFANFHILYRIPAAGGTPQKVVTPDTAHDEMDYLPQFLPDGRHFIFTSIRPDSAQAHAKVASLDSSTVQVLMESGSTALYAAPGYLLYVQNGTLMARAFNAAKLQFTAQAVPVAEGVGSNSFYPYSYISASPAGVLAYPNRSTGPTNQLLWFDRSGTKLSSVGAPGSYSNPAISPDGSRLAVGLVDSSSEKRDIWVFDLKRGTGSPLTFDPSTTLDPAWSAKGDHILFTSEHGGIRGIYSKAADGLGSTDLLYAHLQQIWILDDVSPEGRYAIYRTPGAIGPIELWALPLSGSRKPFPFLKGEFNSFGARISPDGRFVAYVSDESGHQEVYVQTFPDHTGKWQISTSGGVEPIWRRDGKELFYLAPDDTLMSVQIAAASGRLRPGSPRPLFKTRLARGASRNRYAVSPDGQRFLMMVSADEPSSSPVTVVVNWLALLKNAGN